MHHLATIECNHERRYYRLQPPLCSGTSGIIAVDDAWYSSPRV